MLAESSSRLTYQEFQFLIDPLFWDSIRQRLITEWRLWEPTVAIQGFLSTSLTNLPLSTAPNAVYFRRDSFLGENNDSADKYALNEQLATVTFPGTLKNFNTLDALNSEDSDLLLAVSVYERLLKPLFFCEFPTPEVENIAWSSANFSFALIRTFVDAKTYRFYHREAFPVIYTDSPLMMTLLRTGMDGDIPISGSGAQKIHHHGKMLLKQHPSRGCNPFLAVLTEKDEVSFSGFSPRLYDEHLRSGKNVVLCVNDYSAEATSLCWPVRSIITCLRLALPWITTVSVYAIRAGGVENDLLIRCTCTALSEESVSTTLQSIKESIDVEGVPQETKKGSLLLKFTGWRKKKVEVVDLSTMLDPSLRAEQDSRLNLEMMKWRMLPDLELNQLQRCRALLLGTGTLGCNVARNLLMWGVRNITLVDRGHVSFSNLARQSLFSVNDAKVKKHKAIAAAEALRDIIPTVHVQAVSLAIPMPGHRVDTGKSGEVTQELERLIELIKQHDVVFLLTDSRESRWVPTVVAAAHGVPLINSALGFDTYVVMRHGIVNSPKIPDEPETERRTFDDCEIGCYFCSDVVAPTDSMRARTLDEQCTVTRPGVSSIASALAVELLASVYQHPEAFRCPPFRETVGDNIGRARLGNIPQQIRGSVFSYKVSCFSGERNKYCTACAPSILRHFLDGGAEFLLQCINEPKHIEDVCGIAALKEKWQSQIDDMEWSSDEDRTAS